MGSESKTLISAVIVTRNEADRIRGCIESVLELDEHVALSEVILVDSNSSDETVEIAMEYPITVLRIPTDELSTPGAGRQVGFQHASDDLVLFVDGDVHLTRGWIEEAIRTVEHDPRVAGVDGHLAESEEEITPVEGEEESVEHLLAVTLYDVAALETVDGFDPWLNAIEDIDLGYRLRRAGYRLVRLPVVVGTHPNSGGQLRRWHSGYKFGGGQRLRKGFNDPRTLASWLSFYWVWLASATWLMALMAGGLVALFRKGRFRRAWLAVSSITVVAALTFRGPRWTLHKIPSDLLLPVGIAIGFFKYDPDRGEFPFERVEVITRPGSNRA